MYKNKYIIPSIYINAFFILGILSALAIRLIIIFKHINADYIRPFWYIGVIGYTVFFAYRFYITSKRKKLITKHELLKKINNANDINQDDKELLEYIVLSIVKSKENLNYLFIFSTSFIAIIIDLLLNHYY